MTAPQTGSREQLDQHGWIHLRLAVPEDELARWDGVAHRRRAALARNVLADPEARELSASKAMLALVEPFLGPGAFCVRGLLFDKQPGRNWAVFWHQDAMIPVASKPAHDVPGFDAWSVKDGVTHVRPPAAVLESMLTLRLSLDGADRSQGGLMVLSGTHLGGILSETAIRNMCNEFGPESVNTERGEALLMRPLLLHASSRAQTPSRRRVIHLEFAAAPLPKPLEWASQVAFAHISSPHN